LVDIEEEVGSCWKDCMAKHDDEKFCGGACAEEDVGEWITYDPNKPRPTTPTYVGCYKDDKNRDLDFGPKKYGYDVNKCFKACKKNFRYFALQNGSQCFCGNSYNNNSSKYAKVDDKECHDKKRGARRGGHYRNAVYKTHREERKYQLMSEGLETAVETQVGKCDSKKRNTCFKTCRQAQYMTDDRNKCRLDCKVKYGCGPAVVGKGDYTGLITERCGSLKGCLAKCGRNSKCRGQCRTSHAPCSNKVRQEISAMRKKKRRANIEAEVGSTSGNAGFGFYGLFKVGFLCVSAGAIGFAFAKYKK